MLTLTPSQTVGPFVAILVPSQDRESLVTERTSGPRIVVEGMVRDGADTPVPDALVEIWQANAAGHYRHPDDPRPSADDTFDGYGRMHTRRDGRFTFETIKPGSVTGPSGTPQAPHLVVGLYARGLLTRLLTRMYFEDEPSNGQDPILTAVPAERRTTLIATCESEGRYRLDLALQGTRETVFFDV